jgi:uncharacterized protein YecT (DUF1311 family)
MTSTVWPDRGQISTATATGRCLTQMNKSNLIHRLRSLLPVLLFILYAAGPFDHVCLASQAGRELNEADAKLNAAYRSVLSTIADKHQRALLVVAQKAWIKYRDQSVAFFAEHYPYSKGGLFHNIYLIRERTRFLESLLATPPDKDPEGAKASGDPSQ